MSAGVGVKSPEQKLNLGGEDTGQPRQCPGCGYIVAEGECHQCEQDGVLYIVYDGCVGGFGHSQELHISAGAAGDVGIGDPFDDRPLHIVGEVLHIDSTSNADWRTLLGCSNKESESD